MLMSISDIVQVVKENDLVKEQMPASKVLSNTRALINDCKQYWGLEAIDERESLFHLPGRTEHLYRDADLFRSIKKYLDGYGHYKMNKKKAIAYALIEHLEFMGVTEDQAASNDPEAIRKRIFGIK